MSLLYEEPGSPLSMHSSEFDESRVRLPVRSRIIERLVEETGSRSGGRRLTLVKAPTGYGKTRTVLTWLGDGSSPADEVSWVQCVPLHSTSAASFWQMIAHALDASSAHSTAATATDPKELAAELTTRLSSPVTLIIDDYHHATSAENDLALSRLSALSPFLSLVVIARRVTLLDRTVITATTRVRLIGPEVLSLTTAEAIDLASSLGVPASDDLHSALPVSFTQLDVYKIQDQRRALEIVCTERTEEILVDRNIGNLDVGKSALEHNQRLRFLAITVDHLTPILVSFGYRQVTWRPLSP